MNKLLLVFLFILMPLSNAAHAQLPQSGQTTIYATADDGDIQAGKAWPDPRFSDNRDGTLNDNLTGLMWTRDANPMKSHDPSFDMDATAGDGAVTWQHALDYVKYLNAENYLGHNDWRLPNLNELASLLNQGQPGNSLWLTDVGFYAVEQGTYWSSTSRIFNPASVWTVNINTGPVGFNDKGGQGYVRPVRTGQFAAAVALPKTGQTLCFDSAGASIACAGTGEDGELQAGTAWPSPRFNDNGNQTVTDNFTGLTWAKDANLLISDDPAAGVGTGGLNGAVTWQGALDYVAKLNGENYLGYGDWRLPNRTELVSVVNYAETDPVAWLGDLGIANAQRSYWSSGTSALNTANAWNVKLNGVIFQHDKLDTLIGGHVWPVRGGLPAPIVAAVQASSQTSNTLAAQAALQIAKSAAVMKTAATALSISTATVANGYTGTAYSQTLAATGGTSPYTWSKSSGTMPAGLSLSTAGVISGTPTTAGTSSVTFMVKDAKAATATKAISITVNAALTISTTTLSGGYISVAYSQTLAAAGGKTPYTWSVTTGTLPAGLALSAAGVISGTPTTAGSSTFTVQVADANSVKTTKSMTIVINPALTITTASLPDGYLGTSYSQTLAATGGKTAYAWTLSSGTLPTGLTLGTTGVISGTPTAAGSGSITAQVKDANGTTATQSLSITIYAVPSVTTASLPAGTVGSAYSQTLTASGGKTPYTWNVSSGTMPAGLTLGSAGVISGTPTTAVSNSSITFNVSDANSKAASKALTMTINATPPTITTTSLADGYIGVAYSQTLAATGGKTAYTWSVTSGSLPAGLSLATSTGVISGTPTATGSGSITVQVKDANGTTATKSLSITIYAVPSVTTASLPAGAVGTTYSQTLAVSGGKAAFTWSVSNGTLPAGLTINSSTGIISGTPTTKGTSSVTFMVTDANSKTATKTLSITINVASLTITTASLPNGYAGVAYSQTQLAANGGIAPYTWSIVTGSGEYFPFGLTLGSSGVISGTPTDWGTFNFHVQVKDSNNSTVTVQFSIAIIPSVSLYGTMLPTGVAGTAYNQTMSASDGIPPYTWSVISGTLPPGLSLNSSTGVISGTPTVPGSSGFTAQVTDAYSVSATALVSITINPPVNITTTTLPIGYVGFSYDNSLAATGGLPPYTWSITNGALPNGFVLNSSTGVISGSPTSANISNVTIQAQDSGNSVVASKAFSLTISGFGSVGGIVTDQVSGIPIAGATVTLNLSYIENNNLNDKAYTCDGTTSFTANDYSKVASDDEIKYGCYGHYNSNYKLRNPFGVQDPFTMQWKGLSAYTGGEYLAQSFKPTKTGNLTRVSFYFSGYSNTYTPSQGGPYVLLKSSLGGDRGVYLAYSAIMTVSPNTAPGWYDFDMVTPVTVTAGQEYVLELQGNYSTWEFTNNDDYYDEGFWGNGVQYSDGQSYQRSGGIWTQLSNSLAFRTYIDTTPDIITNIPTQNISTHGTAWYAPEINLVNTSTNLWETCNIDYVGNNLFNTDNNSANFGCSLTVSTGSNYYDQNGWITAVLYSNSDEAPATSLVTDQFTLTFNRTLTTTTDTNGAYSFTNLPDGNYSLSFAKTNYGTGNATGALLPGQALNGSSGLVMVSPASLQGAVQASGIPLAGITITVTDQVRTKSVVSDANGNYTITGIAYGPYSATFSGPNVESSIVTGTLAPGQAGIVNMMMFATPSISTSTLPVNFVGTAYSQTLAVSGGKAPYTWSVISGNLPAGLTLNSSTGTIAGTPTATGSSSFTVQVMDANNIAASNTLTMTVYVALSVTTSVLPNTFVGDTYNQTLAASGGTPPLSWSIVSGSLPAGLTLAATTGMISGSPATVGSSSFTVQATDANSFSATMTLSINVTTPPFMAVSLGDVGDVTIMQVTGNYDALNADGSINALPRQMIAKEYFKNHSDTVDFLVFLSTFDFTTPEVGAMAFYTGVKNDTQGINQPIFDNTALYGSQGILQGTIDLGNVTALGAAPYGTLLDQTLKLQAHEMLHRFAAHVNYKNPDGTLNTSLLGKDNDHWSYLLDTQGSVLYGNGWTNNGNGTFTSTSVMSGYSPLDLYLMGMIPQTQVPPMLLISNPAIDPTQLPQLGATISGTATTVSINDIIAAAGPRVPDSTTSQKTFNFAYVLLTRPGDNTSLAQPAIEILRSAWAGKYKTVTQGTGSIASVPATLNVYIDSSVSGATVAGPDVTVTGAVVNSTGAETGVTVNGVLATVNGSQFVANHVPLQSGANTISVSATDVNGLTASASCSVTNTPGYYLRIVPNVTSGTAPLNISFYIDSPFIVTNPTMTTTGPVALALTTAAGTNYTGTISFEGTYTVTASATGPDGQQYSDTVTFTVLSTSQMQTLLQGKWSGIAAKIAANDVDGSVAYFVNSIQANYLETFNALGANFPGLANQLNPINLVYVNDSRAQCSMIRNEVTQGGMVPVEYVVYFSNEDGIWKLRDF
jgi:hypothetical protein